jgi:hypothetical protein
MVKDMLLWTDYYGKSKKSMLRHFAGAFLKKI